MSRRECHKDLLLSPDCANAHRIQELEAALEAAEAYMEGGSEEEYQNELQERCR